MSSEMKEKEAQDVNRRQFLKVGAAGAVGIAAAGIGLNTAVAQPVAPDADKLRTNSKTGIRTAIITDAQLSMGPHLAVEFAKRKYNLVLADVKEGLPDKLRELGASDVLVVPGIEQDGPNNEGRPGVHQKIVNAAMKKFGGYDSVFIRTAWHGGKNILEETAENMKLSYEQNFMAHFYALQAVLPPLIKGGGGQVVIQTSATGEKPHPGVVAYSTMKAAANMLARCAALTVADKNVCVNAVGTNFINYPGFKHTLGADKDPKIMEALLEEIPIPRLGEAREAAHFAMSLLDGYNMFTTGNFYPVAGGFNAAGM